ncbi:MAG: folate-binding protein YgfZ [Rhodospirillaceae bacterium]|jgi:hypothetical protein|nr:folate-binding protein YgfZ [Rhodospirillaceae bacterium]MBT5300498.1 folate-binding protein YgfZ [Rhodospirillaceae bacterium]
MNNQFHAIIDGRGLLKVSGPDAGEFLQGLISNDINLVSAERTIYAALLTAQGKFLFDFFISSLNGDLVLECEHDRLADLMKKLTMYKLRADVQLKDISDDWQVGVLWGDGVAASVGLDNEPGSAMAWSGGVAFVDPRLAGAGLRAVLPVGNAADLLADHGSSAGNTDDYDLQRLTLGLPDGSRDLILEKSILLESGFDELHGVDWKKGCYMGQELTARTKYRGLIKKRLVPVTVDGPLPEPGTPVMADGKDIGEVRSGRGGHALALMRLEHLDPDGPSSAPFAAGDAMITPSKPDWADF